MRSAAFCATAAVAPVTPALARREGKAALERIAFTIKGVSIHTAWLRARSKSSV